MLTKALVACFISLTVCGPAVVAESARGPCMLHVWRVNGIPTVQAGCELLPEEVCPDEDGCEFRDWPVSDGKAFYCVCPSAGDLLCIGYMHYPNHPSSVGKNYVCQTVCGAGCTGTNMAN